MERGSFIQPTRPSGLSGGSPSLCSQVPAPAEKFEQPPPSSGEITPAPPLSPLPYSPDGHQTCKPALCCPTVPGPLDCLLRMCQSHLQPWLWGLCFCIHALPASGTLLARRQWPATPHWPSRPSSCTRACVPLVAHRCLCAPTVLRASSAALTLHTSALVGPSFRLNAAPKADYCNPSPAALALADAHDAAESRQHFVSSPKLPAMVSLPAS